MVPRDPAPAAPWLLTLLREAGGPAPNGHGPAGGDGDGIPVAPLPGAALRARAYLARCDPAVSGQGGHNQTFKVACALVHGFHLSDEDAFDLLWNDYNPRCQPPWSERELRHKVQSARQRGSFRDLGPSTLPGEVPVAASAAASAAAGRPVTDEPEGPVVRAYRLSRVQPKPIEWFWPGWLPLGKLACLEGDPGQGKSTLLLDLAARVSTTGRMPDGSQGVTGNVCLLSGEDGMEDTLHPRLRHAGADLARVFCLDDDVDGHPLVIPDHLPALERRLEQFDARLLVIDPLMAYLANCRSDQEVRRCLTPLKKVAERRRCAVIYLRHLNKSGGSRAMYRGGGFMSIIGQARAALLVAADPHDKDTRILAHVKWNLTPAQTSLTFRLEAVPDTQVCRLAWTGTSPLSADDLLKAAAGTDDGEDREERRTRFQEACAFLTEVLGDGPRPITQVKREGKLLGFSERTLERAARAVQARVIFPREQGQRRTKDAYAWALPCAPEEDGGVAEES